MSIWKDKSGNFAVMTAIVAVPLIGAAGMATDFSMALSRKADLQAAADAAVLAAASMPSTSVDNMKIEATRVFIANLSGDLAKSASVDDLQVSASNYITLNARTRVPLTIGQILFQDNLEVAVSAQSVRSGYQKIEVSMVLDNTGSMSGQKLTDLKAAANSLLKVFETASNVNARFSLVPFSRYVNVGTENRGQPWLSVPNDTSEVRNTCTTSKKLLSKSGCKMVPTTTTNDGVTTTGQKEQCDSYTYDEPVTTCSDKTFNYTWNGCVGSRPSPLDVNDVQPATKYTGLQNTTCGSVVMPLTNNYTSLRMAISKMAAKDETYIPAGILWGWNTLSSQMPMEEALPKGNGLSKFIVLMTDGANTLSPNKSNYLQHTGTDAAKANALMSSVCTNAKAAGITIFTVAVGVTGPTAAGLASCASDSSKAYAMEDSAKLVDVFKTIAGQIITPRLTM
ncbi:pilus assembly protein TadG-related protein [Rhizobium sp. OAE497]|jgi:Flp pilus assembly protein TadG